MTRASLNRTLRRAYVGLGFVLVLALVSKFADRIPGLAGTPVERVALDLYEYLKDMARSLTTRSSSQADGGSSNRGRQAGRGGGRGARGRGRTRHHSRAPIWTPSWPGFTKPNGMARRPATPARLEHFGNVGVVLPPVVLRNIRF